MSKARLFQVCPPSEIEDHQYSDADLYEMALYYWCGHQAEKYDLEKWWELSPEAIFSKFVKEITFIDHAAFLASLRHDQICDINKTARYLDIEPFIARALQRKFDLLDTTDSVDTLQFSDQKMREYFAARFLLSCMQNKFGSGNRFARGQLSGYIHHWPESLGSIDNFIDNNLQSDEMAALRERLAELALLYGANDVMRRLLHDPNWPTNSIEKQRQNINTEITNLLKSGYHIILAKYNDSTLSIEIQHDTQNERAQIRAAVNLKLLLKYHFKLFYSNQVIISDNDCNNNDDPVLTLISAPKTILVKIADVLNDCINAAKNLIAADQVSPNDNKRISKVI